MSDLSPLRVAPDDVDDLRDRFQRTRWSPDWPVSGWAAGTDSELLRRLTGVWASEFDWSARERAINSLPWHTAAVAGVNVARHRVRRCTREFARQAARSPSTVNTWMLHR